MNSLRGELLKAINIFQDIQSWRPGESRNALVCEIRDKVDSTIGVHIESLEFQYSAAMAEKDRELSDTKAALAAVRAQIEADPQVLAVLRKTIEELQGTVEAQRKALEACVAQLEADGKSICMDAAAKSTGTAANWKQFMGSAYHEAVAALNPTPEQSTEGAQS